MFSPFLCVLSFALALEPFIGECLWRAPSICPSPHKLPSLLPCEVRSTCRCCCPHSDYSLGRTGTDWHTPLACTHTHIDSHARIRPPSMSRSSPVQSRPSAQSPSFIIIFARANFFLNFPPSISLRKFKVGDVEVEN